MQECPDAIGDGAILIPAPALRRIVTQSGAIPATPKPVRVNALLGQRSVTAKTACRDAVGHVH